MKKMNILDVYMQFYTVDCSPDWIGIVAILFMAAANLCEVNDVPGS